MRGRTGSVEPTGEDIARRLAAEEVPPITVETREAFEHAVATMLQTGRPISVPSREELEAWVGVLDELEEGDEYDG